MKWLVIMALVVAVVVGGYLAARSQGVSFALTEPPANGSANSASSETFRTHVAALGRLEPASEVVDVSAPPGARIHSLEVREGMEVEKGDVLARLEDHRQRLAARDGAAARLREARALWAVETRYGQAEIRKAELELEQINTLVPLEIGAEEATIRRLQSELGNAGTTLERLKKLHAKERVTDQQVDDQTVLELGLRETLAGAKLILARLEAKRDLDLLAAKERLASARASLERAQLATRVDSLEAELAAAEAELERTVIRAPLGGTVFKVLTHPGERIGEEPILKMGDSSQMFAVAEVYETDARFVRPGQRAIITSEALEAPLRGTVERVSRLIFKNDVLDVDPAARVDARVIEVYIRLDESTVAARFNHLQVRVRIDLQATTGRVGRVVAAGQA